MSKFYLCKMCGNLVEKIEDGGVAPFCCGKKMTCLNSQETEGTGEKHLPVTTVSKPPCLEGKDAPVSLVHIQVGTSIHPSLNNHYIKWVQLQTDKNIYRHQLGPGDSPVVDFVIGCDEKIAQVYAYCNIHGLWASNKIIQ